jgi:uncharacterized protein YecA (UPF0149 family)
MNTQVIKQNRYGTIVKPIDPKTLPDRILFKIMGSRKHYVTRNSKCPCGSGKRFKRCCMMEG